MGDENKGRFDLSAERIGRAFDLPPGVAGVRIELFSNREAVVDGCKGIVEYYDNLIKLNIGNGTVTFSGKNMHIVSFGAEGTVITGKIDNVEYLI